MALNRSQKGHLLTVMRAKQEGSHFIQPQLETCSRRLKFFVTLLLSVNDCTRTASTDLGVTKQANSQIENPVNNEE